MQMMTGMNGRSQLPDEQWRRRQFSPGGEDGGPQWQNRSSQQ
jgi:hypothetical protein